MSKFERFTEFLSRRQEKARIARMKNHPHFQRCDGSGDIAVTKIDKVESGDPRVPSVFGKVTQCTSCKASQGSGTLKGEGYFD